MAEWSEMAGLTKADYEHLANFRYTLRLFLHQSEERAKRAGLTIQQYLALLAIKGFPNRECVTISELAERLQIRHHSAVGLVDRMEKQGLIRRDSDLADRRRVIVSLTEQGARALDQLATANREQLREVSPHLRALVDPISGEGNS